MTSSATETTTVTETDPTDPTAVSATVYLGSSQVDVNDGQGGLMGNGDIDGNGGFYPGYSVDVPLVLGPDEPSNVEQSFEEYESLRDVLIEVDTIVEETQMIDVDTTVDVIEQTTATATREVQ